MDCVPADTIVFTKGSFFDATIDRRSTRVGDDVEYTVLPKDGSTRQVPRWQLRQRVWHWVAFLGITNEKQHVAISTQAFHSRQLEFWGRWHHAHREAGQVASLAICNV